MSTIRKATVWLRLEGTEGLLSLIIFLNLKWRDGALTNKRFVFFKSSGETSRFKTQGFWYFAEKKAKFPGIFRGKFQEKSADFAGKKSKFAEQSADFAGEKSKFAKNSADFAGF